MTHVAGLYRDHEAILAYLRESEPSFHGYLESSLPKVLLLAAASEFEHRVMAHLEDFFQERTGGDVMTLSFLRTKGMARQYHTYFKWDPPPNAGPFFALFGATFKAWAKAQQRDDPDLGEAIADFLTLGSLRNQLVHGNYAAFSLEQTSAELFSLYESASRFVAAIPVMLRAQSGEADAAADAEAEAEEG